MDELATSYKVPIPTLLPRPALLLMGFVASSIFLLEHAVWAFTTGETDNDIDVEVFRRWVLEGGLIAAIEDVKRAKGNNAARVLADSAITFGGFTKAKM